MRFYSKTKLIISIIVGIAVSGTVAITIYVVQIKTANTNAEIMHVKYQVQGLINKLYREEVTYEEILRIGIYEGRTSSYLSNYNLSIANAKYNIRTKGYHDDPVTIKESKKSYRTKRRVITTAILVGVFSPILTIPFCMSVIFLVIFIPNFLWHFILDRISELSKSIQGKR